MIMTYEDELKSIILSTDWLMLSLKTARDFNLPNWYIGAGAIRNTVWNKLHNFTNNDFPSDIDLIYYSETVPYINFDKDIENKLNHSSDGCMWDVTNQFHVDVWYESYYGVKISKIKSSEDGISIWPETSTAVAVRLDSDDNLIIAAPFGLDDLFNLQLRWNKKVVSQRYFLNRINEKQFLKRWPKLSIVN